MIKAFAKCAVAALAISAAYPAQAQQATYKPIERKNLDSGKASIAADKAYIYLSAPTRVMGVFLKTPDAEDLAEYDAEWRKELEEAKRKYPGRLKRYESDIAVWRKTKSGREPQKPVEPTEASFSIGAMESRMVVPFGPQFVYDKSDGEEKKFSYLVEVEPGTYSYYGPLFYGPGVAPMGTCYCMGSVKFEAAAGKVTSLGNFLGFEWVTKELSQQAAVNTLIERSAAEAKPIDLVPPPELAAKGAVEADLRAAGKINNIFGVMVGRMPPVAGILAYERDVPIDVKGLAQANADAEAAAVEEAAGSDSETTATENSGS